MGIMVTWVSIYNQRKRTIFVIYKNAILHPLTQGTGNKGARNVRIFTRIKYYHYITSLERGACQ